MVRTDLRSTWWERSSGGLQIPRQPFLSGHKPMATVSSSLFEPTNHSDQAEHSPFSASHSASLFSPMVLAYIHSSYRDPRLTEGHKTCPSIARYARLGRLISEKYKIQGVALLSSRRSTRRSREATLVTSSPCIPCCSPS